MKNEYANSILLVEDQVIIAMSVKNDLEKYGYTVYHVNNGEKAVHAISNNTFPVELILMDIDLGSGIDGTQAAEQILNLKDIPVVFLSAHTEPEVVEKTEKITSYGYIVKNSNITVLDASIKMAFKLYNKKIEHKKSEQELITARKKAEESELTFRKLFEDSADAILLIDKTGVFVECNQAALNLLKMSREQFLFKPPVMISPEYQPNGRKSDEAAIEMIETAYTKGLNRFDWTCINTMGEEFSVEVSLMPIVVKGQTMLHTTWRDITERKRVEKALTESQFVYKQRNEILNTLLDNLTSGVFMVEAPSGKPIIANKEAQRLLGRGITQEVSKDNLAEVYHAHLPGSTFPYPAEKMPIVRGMYGEATHIDDMIVDRPDGMTTQLEIFGSPVYNEQGKVWASLVSFQDITDRKRTEEEIRKQLSEKNTLLREVHHRVKNNIASIESFLSLQANSNSNHEIQSALYDAIARVQSMRILYDKLLLTSDYQDISIKSYVENLIKSILVVFVINDVKIEQQIDDFIINSKKVVSVGIIINELLTNVFKYAFKDHRNGKVCIAIIKIENKVTVTIQDNGIGINTHKEANNSSGLGLTLVAMLVEQLHGTYTTVNENGTKSIICFEL